MNEVGQMALKWIFYGYQGFLYTWFLFRLLDCRFHSFSKGAAAFLCGITLFLAGIFLEPDVLYLEWESWLYLLIPLGYALLFMKDSLPKKMLVSLLPSSCAAIASLLSLNCNQIIVLITIGNIGFHPTWSVYGLNAIFDWLVRALFQTLLLLLIRRITAKNGLTLSKSENILMETVLGISVLMIALLYLLAFGQFSVSSRTYLSVLMDQCYLSLLVLGIVAINLVIYVLLGKLSLKHKLETENALLKYQYRIQEQSTTELKKHYQELQKIRHDVKNSMNVLQILNKQGKQKAVDQYIQEYLQSQTPVFQYANTKNLVLNAILNEKCSKAHQIKIEVTMELSPQVVGIEDVDLCNLIGNLFDNAIEGCRCCKTKKEIVFALHSTPRECNLFLKNTIQDSVLTDNPALVSTKPDAENHGFGTKIIRDITAKYSGLVDYYEEDGYFCCNLILLPHETAT